MEIDSHTDAFYKLLVVRSVLKSEIAELLTKQYQLVESCLHFHAQPFWFLVCLLHTQNSLSSRHPSPGKVTLDQFNLQMEFRLTGSMDRDHVVETPQVICSANVFSLQSGDRRVSFGSSESDFRARRQQVSSGVPVATTQTKVQNVDDSFRLPTIAKNEIRRFHISVQVLYTEQLLVIGRKRKKRRILRARWISETDSNAGIAGCHLPLSPRRVSCISDRMPETLVRIRHLRATLRSSNGRAVSVPAPAIDAFSSLPPSTRSSKTISCCNNVFFPVCSVKCVI